VIQASRLVKDRLMDHAESMLERIDTEQEAKKLIDSFGSSLESSESTLDRSH
jgi:chromosome condensin MukBEF ATPase and DNA-binding subunit MukB